MKLTERKLFAGERYPLLFAHKLAIGALLVFSVLFLVSPQRYEKEYHDEVFVTIPYLQEGDYVADYVFTAPSNGAVQLQVMAGWEADEENGELIIAREDLREGTVSGSVAFSLERSVRGIWILLRQEAGEVEFASCKISSVHYFHTDHLMMCLLCMLSALTLALLGCFLPPEKYKYSLAAVGFGLLASFPLANDIFMEAGSDASFHLARLESVYRGMAAGEFPVRIGSVQMRGFGSLSATLYPQLFLYPAALLRFLGASLQLCYKLLITGCNIGCALLTFHAVKNMCKSEKIGLYASFLYTFAQYRLIDIYQRGALGESLAMTFMPLVIWGIYEVLWGNVKKWYLLALGMTCVLQSHVLSTEICIFFLGGAVLVWLILGKKKEMWVRMLAGIGAAALTVLINLSTLIPFVFFYGEGLQCFNMPNQLPGTLLYFNQMFFSYSQMLGVSNELGSLNGEMPLTVGGVLLLGAILFVAMLGEKRERTGEERIGIYCLLFGMAALLMTSWIFPWKALSGIRLVDTVARSLQFAWRLLGPASLFLCIVTAVGVKLFEERKTGREWILGCVVLLVFLSTTYFFEMCARQAQQTNDKMMIGGIDGTDAMYMYYDGESYKAHNLDGRYSTPFMRSEKKTAAYSGLRRNGSGLRVEVIPGGEAEDVLIFPIYYYPGYRVRVNGERVENYSYDTLLAIDMPAGPAAVEVSYTGPAAFAVGDAVSLAVLSGVFLYAVVRRRRRASAKKC